MKHDGCIPIPSRPHKCTHTHSENFMTHTAPCPLRAASCTTGELTLRRPSSDQIELHHHTDHIQHQILITSSAAKPITDPTASHWLALTTYLLHRRRPQDLRSADCIFKRKLRELQRNWIWRVSIQMSRLLFVRICEWYCSCYRNNNLMI